MGTVHKFKRPPKNSQQFRGYKPKPTLWPGGKGSRRLRPWQRSVIAWLLLVMVAAAIVAVRPYI